MKQPHNSIGMVLYALVAVILTALTWLAPGFARAGSLSSMSDTITNPAPSSASDHYIRFTTGTAIPASGKIVITPEATKFTIPVGLDYTDIDAIVNGGDKTLAGSPGSGAGSNFGASVTTGSSGGFTVTLNDTDSIAGGSTVEIKIGTNATIGTTGDQQMSNPSSLGSFTINLATKTSANSPLDSGQLAIATANPVGVGGTSGSTPPPPAPPPPAITPPPPSGTGIGSNTATYPPAPSGGLTVPPPSGSLQIPIQTPPATKTPFPPHLTPPPGTLPPITLPPSDTTQPITPAVTLPDTYPPTNLFITVGRDASLFNNNYYAAFRAEDSGSGINHYDIAELPLTSNKLPANAYPKESDWRRAHVPEKLQHQQGRLAVFIRAVDNSGNSLIGNLTTSFPQRQFPWGLLLILLLVLILIFTLWYVYGRNKHLYKNSYL